MGAGVAPSGDVLGSPGGGGCSPQQRINMLNGRHRIQSTNPITANSMTNGRNTTSKKRISMMKRINLPPGILSRLSTHLGISTGTCFASHSA